MHSMSSSCHRTHWEENSTEGGERHCPILPVCCLKSRLGPPQPELTFFNLSRSRSKSFLMSSAILCLARACKSLDITRDEREEPGSDLRHLGVHPLHPQLVGGDGGRPLQDDAVPPVHRARAPGLRGAGWAHPGLSAHCTALLVSLKSVWIFQQISIFTSLDPIKSQL